MAPTVNGRVLFNDIPSGYPEPGKTVVYDESETLDLDAAPLNGGFLVKILYVSIDPYMRGKMRSPEQESYTPAYVIGKPIDNFGVGRVLRSENPSIQVGSHLYGIFPFQKYFIGQDAKSFRVLKNEGNVPWSAYLGVCGMPGQTAWYAWKEYSAAQKGDIVFVTAGSGPVGSTVIQLAKLEGLKVIASAGSDDKVAWIKSLGADVAFNYKTQSTKEILGKEGPVNIYWDNVGGETLDIVLEAAASNARFIECGMISAYNTGNSVIKNILNVVAKEIHLHGFLVFSFHHKYEEAFYKEVPIKVANGEIKYREDRSYGLESVGQAIVDVQKGHNTGKKIIVVAEE